MRTGKRFRTALVAVLCALACADPVNVPSDELTAQETENRMASPVVDTGQDECFGLLQSTSCPNPGSDLFGQDAQHDGAAPAYSSNGDGTVTDLNTGLMWTQTPDLNGDGVIDSDDKLTYSESLEYVGSISTGGHTDWRVPTIKELYSLMDFRGEDLSGVVDPGQGELKPFLDDQIFGFGYGDTAAGERPIDAQFATVTIYTSTTMGGNTTMFGVNFADGRIKGYPAGPTPMDPNGKGYYVLFVRGEQGYGVNRLIANGDGTVTDLATDLMWSQDDSGRGMDWQEALAWVQEKNAEAYLGHDDWRLPNAKELQGLVDYSRSPNATNSAAIDPTFSITEIVNEAGQLDFPAFWTSTTHANNSSVPGGYAVYISFGRAMGYMNGQWMDVHGAGAQRSDPKVGDAAQWPTGHGPQGDAIRIDNFVRLVRDAS
jgi:hypothetical protein